MRIGYAQNLITSALDKPVFLAGFGNNRCAESIHDDLYIRSLVIQDGDTTLVLAALDLIGFFRSYVNEIRDDLHQSYPDVQVVIASTHTHHGPDTMGLWGPDMHTSGVDRVYLATLKEKVKATILTGIDQLQPARLRTAAVIVPGVVKNARNPDILDEELILAQFIHPQDETVLTSLFNFPCHPEVLWEHNPHITADYPGFLRQAVENATGAPCIFFSGALGGMMTPDVHEHSFAEAAQIGQTLAKAGLQASGHAISSLQAQGLHFYSTQITVKLTNPLFKLAFRRKLLPDNRNQRGEIETEVNLVKLGSLWLATVPGELLPRLGLSIKSTLRQAGAQIAGVIGLANDELGYILPKEDFRYPVNPFRPGKHYEETMSISKDIGPKVMEAVRRMIVESG